MSRKPTSRSPASSQNVNRNKRPLRKSVMTVPWKVNLVAHDESRRRARIPRAIQGRTECHCLVDAAEGMVVGIDRGTSYTAEVCLFTALLGVQEIDPAYEHARDLRRHRNLERKEVCDPFRRHDVQEATAGSIKITLLPRLEHGLGLILE